jgi:CheY-like chemotaxis protein
MKRILVVDDDGHLRELLTATLEQDVAQDGVEALALLGTNSYDVVLSDLRMPGLDGPALYGALRAMRHTTTVPRGGLHDGQRGR